MPTVLLVLALAALLGWAVWRTVRRARKGSACCGEREAAPKAVQPADTRRANYPYTVTLRIGGMTCDQCAKRVANALNSLDGVWAKVDIATHTASVRLKAAPDEARLRAAVTDAGYILLGMEP